MPVLQARARSGRAFRARAGRQAGPSPVAVHLSAVRPRWYNRDVTSFDAEMTDRQVRWRRHNVDTAEAGVQNKVTYPWLLPRWAWQQGLWPPLRGEGPAVAADVPGSAPGAPAFGRAQPQELVGLGGQSLLPLRSSPQTAADCWPGSCAATSTLGCSRWTRSSSSGPATASSARGRCSARRAALAAAVRPRRTSRCASTAATACCWSRTSSSSTPSTLARRASAAGRSGAPATRTPRAATTCPALLADPGRCHQASWGRQYWERLYDAIDAGAFAGLPCCPASRAGYQLLRQQALAEALAHTGRYGFVVSAVALDARNVGLARSLKSSGLPDVRDWGRLFRGRASFAVFTHQDWVTWVRARDPEGSWRAWAGWIAERYGL